MKIDLRILSSKLMTLLITASFAFIVLTCFSDLTKFNSSSTVLGFLLVIMMIILILFALFSIERKISTKWYIIFLLFLTIGLRLVWINTIQADNVSDFAIMYNSAVRAAKGDFGFTSEGIYFQRWGYQLGFTMYQALILKLFGGGTYLLKLLNAFYSTGTTLLIYFITRRLFNEACGRIAGILYALYIPSIAMSSVLTNDHLSTFLFYLAFYLMIRSFETSKYMWILIGVLLSAGDIIRPLGSLVLVVFAVYVLIFGGRKKRWFLSAGKLTGVFLVFFLTHSLVSTAFIDTGVTKYPLSNGDPYWKFVTGLNPNTNGIFSNQDSKYLSQFPLGEKRNQASLELIKQRISNKQQLLTLFRNKFVYMWTSEDGSLIWGLRSKEHDNTQLLESLSLPERFIYLVMAVFTLIAGIQLLFKKEADKRIAFFMLLILGYFCIHLLIEIQTRYRYFIIPSFMIFESGGIYAVYSLLKLVVQPGKQKIKMTD